MNIQEAVKKALAENKCITIPTEEGKIYFKIKPTNNVEENCILIDHENIPMPKNICALSHGWQPNANFLISNDWIVVNENQLKTNKEITRELEIIMAIIEKNIEKSKEKIVIAKKENERSKRFSKIALIIAYTVFVITIYTLIVALIL